MSDEPEPKSHPAAWDVTLSILPVVYALSIGPMIYVTEKLHLSSMLRTPLRTFYAPITWAHDNTPLKKPLEGYVEWWEQLAKDP